MLAAIRDASVGEGQRIRGTKQGIQAGWLYSEFARVALFESEETYGGLNVYTDGQKVDALNRFWLADLEDFDQRPARSVKRLYYVAHNTRAPRRSIEGFRGLELGISEVDLRRQRLLAVDTSRLVESFGVDAIYVGSGSIASGVNLRRIGRPDVQIYDRLGVRVTRSGTRGSTQDMVPDRAMGTEVAVTEALPEVPTLGDVEAVLGYLRDRGLDHFASKLEYKKVLIEEDPDDPPVDLESARGFAGFVTLETLAGDPNVTVDADGYVGLEWVILDPLALETEEWEATGGRHDDRVWGKGHGVLGLWFLPDGMVRIYGTSGPVRQDVVRMRVNCTVTAGHVMNAIEPFMSRLGDR